MKKVLIFLIFILIVVGGVVAGVYYAVPKYKYICYIENKDYSTVRDISNKWIKLTIPQGATTMEIANILASKNLIEDKDYFICYTVKNKILLKSGIFYVPGKISTNELLKILQEPQDPYVHITIPEGYRLDQTAKKLELYFVGIPYSNFKKDDFLQIVSNKNQIQDNYGSFEFIKSIKPSTLEGFLFPETYDFEKDVVTENIIRAMLNQFGSKAWPILNKSTEVLQLSPYQALIIASIVERETNNNFEERQMVADIIIRRLKNNWLLQTDAVLLYYYKDWSKTLTIQDLKQNTPYNVYLHKGLPPTPICSPGETSIKAVLEHKPNNYWYYMHDKNGKIHYSTTFTEHVNNVNKYLR